MKEQHVETRYTKRLEDGTIRVRVYRPPTVGGEFKIVFEALIRYGMVLVLGMLLGKLGAY